MKCYNCGYTWVYDFMEACPQCNAYVKCCKNCNHFVQNTPNICREGFREYNKISRNACTGFAGNTRLF